MSSTFKRTTVDQDECIYFKNLSSTWWDNPKLKILQSTCELFVPYICKNIEQAFPDKPLNSLRILEVGCGGGFMTERLTRAGCNLVAIDINEALLEIAKTHSQSDSTLPKIQYLLEAVEDHCKENSQQYDVVISNFVLEHVADHDYFIKCCSNCVKPGGLLFMSTLPKTFFCRLFTIFGIEKVLRLLPIGIHHYDKCITASNTERIMKSYNFKIKRTRGIFMNLLNQSLFFVPTTTFAYITCATRNAE